MNDIIVNLRLQVFYEFLPNRYGKTNRHWEIITFPTSRVLTTSGISENTVQVPEIITLANTSYTTNKVVKAYGKIIINGTITATTGITVDLIAPEIINNSPSPLPSNVRLIISELNVYGDTKTSQVSNSFVKTFCASTGQYKAKELDPAARQAQEDGYKPIEEEEIEEGNFNVFPNPASNQLTFRFHIDETSNVNITLHDLSGKAVIMKFYMKPVI
jgi:hypothetical protein